MAASLVWPAMNNGHTNALHPFFTTKPKDGNSFGGPEGSHHAVQVSAHSDSDQKPETSLIPTLAGTDVHPREPQAEAPDFSVERAVHNAPEMPLSLDGHADRPPTSGGATMWPISSKGFEPKPKRRKVHHDADPGVLPTTEPICEDTSYPAAAPSEQNNVPGGACDTVKNGLPESATKQKSPPRKMLKLSASGKLASPKPVKPDSVSVPDSGRPKRRGRPRRSLVAVCRYKTVDGEATSTGQLIEDIMTGAYRHPKPMPVVKQPAKSASRAGPAKSTHPFFTGAREKPAVPAKDTSMSQQKGPPSPHRKSFASTPGKIRQQMAQMRSDRVPPPSFGPAVSAPARNNNAKSEIWPGPGMMHLRGLATASLPTPPTTTFTKRKKKLAAHDRSIVSSVLAGVNVAAESASATSRLRDDGFSDPHPSLRVPQRSLLTGTEIFQAVQKHLSVNAFSHSAVSGLAKSIHTHLTAYDHGRGESLPWTAKYAPAEAATVLQTTPDAMILRDWMNSLAINSVGGALATQAKPKPDLLHKKKRRKKLAELDDFIVSSGDEDEQLGALGGIDEIGSQGSSQGASQTLVRAGANTADGEPAKLANAVVLSGPHGCGKTAMVFAVAKELGYQVFEINAGSRRSGRDVVERIGDVVANHIVSHGKQESGNLSADEDSKRISDAFQKDLDSGRQGTMKSFFTSAPRRKEPVAKVAQKRAAADAVMKIMKEPSRHQKQSIILLEEVDLLFEDDKAFWSTIVSLLVTSRRPVVMTCTEEWLLPLDDLILHAIIRLSVPEEELAVDYLLLMAAQEGHLLDRASVQSLYQQKRGDLRASIVDLQFWCQMGVGDPRGGLSWIFQRWPAGTGVDADGNCQRVVSTGAHHVNMGALPCEREDMSVDDMQQELACEAWVHWSLDPRDEAHLQLPEALAVATDPEVTVIDKQSRLEGLRKMERLTETLSSLGIQGQLDLPVTASSQSRFAPLGSMFQQHLDPSQPEISSKSRSNFTESPSLLQADEAVDYMQLSRPLAITTLHLLPTALGIPRAASRLSSLLNAAEPYTHLSPTPSSQIHGALEPLAEPMTQSAAYTTLFAPLPALVDVAAYIRAIAAHDASRATQYADLGGKRKTRAARGAVEGRGRGGVRREKWWDVELDLSCTAGEYMRRSGRMVADWAAEERAKIELEFIGSQGSTMSV